MRGAFPGGLETKTCVVVAHGVKTAIVGWFGVTSEEMQHPWIVMGSTKLALTTCGRTGQQDTAPLRGLLGTEEEGQESEGGKNFIPGDDRGKWEAPCERGGG